MNCRTFCVKFGQQALVGEDSGEEQLFSSEGGCLRDGISSELDSYLQNLKVLYFFSNSLSLPPKESKKKKWKKEKIKLKRTIFFLDIC